VRTAGRGSGGYGAEAGKSWLLIKHRDEWSGDLDITDFAPRSVKSDGDFEDILAEDNPDIWVSNRPAKGGETGAMLASIIKKAAEIRAGRGAAKAPARKTAAKSSAKSAARTRKTTTRKPRSAS
jgi:hypothetical protein